MTVNPPTPHGRRAVRNDAAAHPRAAVAWLVVTMALLGATLGSAYQGPSVLTWVLGAAAVVAAGCMWVALLPDGGPADEYDPWACPECGADVGRCPTYCSLWEPASDYDDDVLGFSDDEGDDPDDERSNAVWFAAAQGRAMAALDEDQDEDLDDDVRADAREHADEDDPFGVIGGAP